MAWGEPTLDCKVLGARVQATGAVESGSEAVLATTYYPYPWLWGERPALAAGGRAASCWATSESTIDGALNLEGTAVIFYGAIRDCAEFVRWYQAAAPEVSPLLLCNEGYSRSLTLQPTTTFEELMHALGHQS